MKWTLTAICLMCLPTLVWAQDRPTLVSPDVRKDRTVVFKLWAPKASDVELSGSWMGPQPPVALTRDADGVWSTTVGPLEPNIYTYGFLVDGVRASDPSCRCSLTAANRFSESTFVIPGDPPRSWEIQNRPAGTLYHERFFSARQQRLRRFIAYTPPGYESSGTREYPALILLPGTPGAEQDWTSGGGFAEVMFDNLIASGQMVPMIVIMHASDVLESATSRRGNDNLREFESILVNELVPFVKQRYRVLSDARSWAIAGLSLGGEFGMAVGLKHPELFRTVASLSGSLVPSSFNERFAMDNPQAIARDYQLIWVGCGSEDIFFGGAKAFVERLEGFKVPHVFRQFSGPHIMPVFRQELEDLLPRLFRR